MRFTASPSKRSPALVRPSAAPRHERALIPVGMSTILPDAAQRVRRLEGALLTVLGRWGYREIIPPAFEYLDVLAAGLDPEALEQCYKFADRTTGRMLVLRPDVTAQIARMVAMGMVDSGLPLRLSYRSTVFRHEPEHAGRDREIFQVGAELIGVDDAAMDAESVALMVECLAQLGLPAFTISLGHVGFFKALLAKTGMSAEGRKRAEQAAARKDLPYLEDILAKERVPKPAARGILEAPNLYGREEVLRRGRVLAGRDRRVQAPLDRLTQVYRLLAEIGLKDRLLLDLGEFRGFDYYDGVVFDVFAEGVGCELGGGGRYDHLIGRFGRDLPSTGFAFDVGRLFQAMERAGEGASRAEPTVLVSAPVRRYGPLFHVARRLRQAGLRVVQGLSEGTGRAAIRAAVEEGRRLAASSVVMLGGAALAADEALVLRGPGLSRRATVKLRDLSATRLTS